MKYTEEFSEYKLEIEGLMAAGFQKKGRNYEKEIPLQQGDFLARFQITSGQIDVEVFEMPERMLFLPFEIADFDGAFVAQLREEVATLFGEILQIHGKEKGLKEKVVKQIKERFEVEPVAPWGEGKGLTFHHPDNGKWFALLTQVPKKSLGMKGEGEVDILNLKLAPEKVKEFVTKPGFCKAWHMNKTHWLTILLNGSAAVEDFGDLLEESYQLVGPKS